MCGIAGIISLTGEVVPNLEQKLRLMNDLQRHRGPDGEGIWIHENNHLGFAHRRLSIIDLTTGDQPMKDDVGNCIIYNGEVYNYLELRQELGEHLFRTQSDTEAILRAYLTWEEDCLNRLRGMFSFALWDERQQVLFCARDHFGIKPFYYAIVNNTFYFASEVKALLPFLPSIETDIDGLKDYLTFQFCLDGKTLFKGVKELPAGHKLVIKNGNVYISRFWEVYYELDFDHTAKYFEEKLRERLLDSIALHLRSDVPLGFYISGGLDSSAVTSLGKKYHQGEVLGFTGKYSLGPEYDESMYAEHLAAWCGVELLKIEITVQDFINHIRDVIYYLDYPTAGPGSFSQYMVSQLAAQYRKVVLGGQGGDEIFGGYTRYLIAYFEQCIKAAIEGTMHNGNFIVTYESIIPNLTALAGYKSTLQEFWKEGLFEPMDRRYFRLINRAPLLGDEIDWQALGDYSPYETFKQIFNGNNVRKESYFDLMTHFDFKTLLPALLHVEDRVSMAHGLESRVPLLDWPLIELAATIPSNIKFENGTMKHIFRKVVEPFLPQEIINRKDKMGFPTPFTEWVKGEAHSFVVDIMTSAASKTRPFINNQKVVEKLQKEPKFGRTFWGLFCLEIWQQEFHDREWEFKSLLKQL